MPPSHHTEIANFLGENADGKPSVTAYRDSNGNRPIPIGEFGDEFFSTIGALDMGLSLPTGHFEFAASGSFVWLPNALASSIYWLTERDCDVWPLVCEDVVKDNARSSYRHMVYVPSPFTLRLTTGQVVKWLMGVPISDSDISISVQVAFEKAKNTHPEWLFRTVVSTRNSTP